MNSMRAINPVARAVLVIGAVMALVTSITFAALQNTATLANNTISGNVDGLLVDSDGDDSFAPTDEGFAFNDVDPGTMSDAKAFSLKNETDSAMPINVQVVGEEPLPSGVDGTDIKFLFDTDADGDTDVTATWAEIIVTDGVQLLPSLAVDAVADMTVKVEVDASVSDDFDITPFNFLFGSPSEVEAPSVTE